MMRFPSFSVSRSVCQRVQYGDNNVGIEPLTKGVESPNVTQYQHEEFQTELLSMEIDSRENLTKTFDKL